MEYLKKLFDTSGFPPRWNCGTAWTDFHGWVHIISDLLIWAAYMSIPFMLVYYINKRPNTPFPKVFYLFSAFIFYCGIGHLIEAIIFWNPIYRFSALNKSVTAIVSVATAITLFRLLPEAIKFKSPTEVKRLGAELEEQKEKLFKLMQNSLIGVTLIDLNGKCLDANNAMCELLGYSKKDLLNVDFRKITHKDDVKKEDELYKKILSREKSGFQIEKRFLHKNSEIVWVIYSVSAIKNKDGNVKYLISQAQDITSTKENEEKRLKDLVNSISSIAWFTDKEGGFSSKQESWMNYTGQPWKEHKGFGWVNAIHPDDRELLLSIWKQALANKTTYKSEGRIWNNKLEKYCYFNAYAVPVLANDEIYEWQGIVVDIDEITQIKQTFEIDDNSSELASKDQIIAEKAKALVALNNELEQFTYVASHDLQEPLRKVTAFGDRLKNKYENELGEQGKEYLDRMLSATYRMQNLIDDLLDYSRAARGPQELKEFDLNIIISEVLEDLESRIRDTSGKVNVNSKLPSIKADPTQMRQLFQNLIGNALKFHKKEEKPIINVNCGSEKGFYKITIEDNGIGFEDEYKERIFKPFQRLHTRTEYKGTGIGLSICKKITNSHGGDITAESKVNKGTTFTIVLPKS